MNRFVRLNRVLLASIAIAAMTWPTAQAAHAKPPSPPAVPAAIEVPDGNSVFLVGHAVGVQIYACTATSDGFAWSFLAPRADLYDDKGKLLTTHFGGPTWQARDGSSVVGQREAGVTVDDSTIPWLLLSAAETTAVPDGDRLVETTFIQRIATTGGLAPAASECNATAAGSHAEVAYTADYYFWR
jgi:hypothetical protein